MTKKDFFQTCYSSTHILYIHMFVLLLSTLVLHAAVRAHVDHLHCPLLPSPLLSVVVLHVLLSLLLCAVSPRRAEGTNTQHHSPCERPHLPDQC